LTVFKASAAEFKVNPIQGDFKVNPIQSFKAATFAMNPTKATTYKAYSAAFTLHKMWIFPKNKDRYVYCVVCVKKPK